MILFCSLACCFSLSLGAANYIAPSTSEIKVHVPKRHFIDVSLENGQLNADCNVAYFTYPGEQNVVLAIPLGKNSHHSQFELVASTHCANSPKIGTMRL